MRERERTLFEGNCNMAYYFWPNSTRFGVGIKSVRGHCAVERMSLRYVSAVAKNNSKISQEILSYILESWENLWKITKWHRETTLTWVMDHLSQKKVNCKNRNRITDHLWCVPTDSVWTLLLKQRCRSHCISTSDLLVSFWYALNNICWCQSKLPPYFPNLHPHLPLSKLHLFVFCVLLFQISSTGCLLVVQQPWLSLYLEGPCSPSYSLAGKTAYKRRTSLYLLGYATTKPFWWGGKHNHVIF